MEKDNKGYTIPEPKKNNKSEFIIILLGVAVIIIVAILAVSKLFKDEILPLKEKNNNDIKLNYTKTTDEMIKGVYITDVSEVVENVMPSIVAITSKTLVSSGMFGPSFFGYNFGNNEKQYQTGAGSGIIISKTDTELLILTNNHVIAGAESLSVKFIDDKSYDASLKGTSARKDVAVIAIKLSKIDKETLEKIKIATIGKSDELKVGNGVIAIGNALGYGQSVTTGVVSAIDRTVNIDGNANKMIQIDAAINGGNSGGALLNAKGEVVGINSAKYSSSGSSTSASVEGMGFAIPITDIDKLITTLMNGEEEEKAVLGVSGYITEGAYNMPDGFYISEIISGSGADKAGLEIGNIIVKIDGKDIKTFSDMSDILYEKKPGETVELKIKYPNKNTYKEKTVKVTLTKEK